MHSLTGLVEEIDRITATVGADTTLADADVRRLLRFIGQVVQVIEQAFQDVLGLLVELSCLEYADLEQPKRMRELRITVEMLTARSYYRDAAEICSRLKHLGESFDQFVRPAVQHLPQFASWQGVFGLIEHREGRIIFLIEETAREIASLLDRATPDQLRDVKAIATAQSKELRALLAELHDLNGRILGFSHRPGFLELTSNRLELQREIMIMVDKSDRSVKSINLGPGASVSGSVVIATSIRDSFNAVEQSAADSSLKSELRQLCDQIEALLPQLPEARHADVTQDLDNLVKEATKPEPRRKWYQLSAEGLLDAAKACGAVATPIVATIKNILSMLAG